MDRHMKKNFALLPVAALPSGSSHIVKSPVT
jgi:hypothetical protein